MIEYLLIAILLALIGFLAWKNYTLQKHIDETRDVESLKSLFPVAMHLHIDKIASEAHELDMLRILLEEIQERIEKNGSIETLTTKVKKLEKNLTQRQQTLTHTSHQMRTSLSGLLGFVQFLDETQLNDEQREYTQFISESTEELLKVVNEVLSGGQTTSLEERGLTIKKELPKPAIPKATKEPKGIRYVMVVDDNTINQKLMKKVLETLDLEVTLAYNGEEAVKARKKEAFDLIFMDIQMPVMDGVEACKEIRKYEEENKEEHVTIVALTANAEKSQKDEYLNAGMDDYISKPIIVDEVKEKLEKYQ